MHMLWFCCRSESTTLSKRALAACRSDACSTLAVRIGRHGYDAAIYPHCSEAAENHTVDESLSKATLCYSHSFCAFQLCGMTSSVQLRDS